VIIDFHTHIFPPWLRERREEYVKSDPCFSLLYAQPKARVATAEELIASMDEAEIDVSVVLNAGWVGHDLCVKTNDYILDSVARYPTRLVGFCAIQPRAGDAAIAEIERCAQAGAKGVGELRSDVQGFNLADRTAMEPVVDALLRHDLILLTHSSEPVGHEYPGKGSITPDILCSFIMAFPKLKIVCAHWGGGLPFYALMPEVARALGKAFFEEASRIIGSNKILFGTDYPLVHQRIVSAQVQSAQLPQKDKARILGANAQKLLYCDEKS
jgi:hypothetical protein